MGFPEDVCTEALERYDGDENLALNYLLGGWDIELYFVYKCMIEFVFVLSTINILQYCLQN
jgi:hypothetical protein